MPGTQAYPTSQIGTYAWQERTNGALSRADRRQLLKPLVRAHVTLVTGRLAGALGMAPGRTAGSVLDLGPVPCSALARAAERLAQHRLTPVLLNHSYRTFAFGTTLGRLSGLDVDRDLLFAAAMLHDLGLTAPTPHVDFTMAGARAARDIAEQVGLSGTATDTLLTAITVHHSPGVSPAHGPVAHLLSAGAGLDVVGLRARTLPPDTLDGIVSRYPRLGFKRAFVDAWRTEAERVPAGRAAFLHRWGAFSLAIRLAPFTD